MRRDVGVVKEIHSDPKCQIEVTPEMIEAGVRAFYGPDWGKELAENAVRRIFLAMIRAAAKANRSEGCGAPPDRRV